MFLELLDLIYMTYLDLKITILKIRQHHIIFRFFKTVGTLVLKVIKVHILLFCNHNDFNREFLWTHILLMQLSDICFLTALITYRISCSLTSLICCTWIWVTIIWTVCLLRWDAWSICRLWYSIIIRLCTHSWGKTGSFYDLISVYAIGTPPYRRKAVFISNDLIVLSTLPLINSGSNLCHLYAFIVTGSYLLW